VALARRDYGVKYPKMYEDADDSVFNWYGVWRLRLLLSLRQVSVRTGTRRLSECDAKQCAIAGWAFCQQRGTEPLAVALPITQYPAGASEHARELPGVPGHAAVRRAGVPSHQ
jgi:hypothetical protein